MISSEEQTEAVRRVQARLVEAGITTTTVKEPAQGLAQHVTFNFPVGGPTTVNLVRPEGRRLSVFITGTTVSPEHLAVLQGASHEYREDVSRCLRRVALQGGVVGFAANVQGDLLIGWRLDLEIHDDGLTEQNLFHGLRVLISKHLALIDAFNDALDARRPRTYSGATGSSGYF